MRGVVEVSLYYQTLALPQRLDSLVAQPSETLRLASDEESGTSSTEYSKLKEVYCRVAGLWRVRFDLRSSSSAYTAYACIYRNGVVYGTSKSTTSTTYVTFTEDMYFGANEYIQVYGYISSAYGGVYVRNFRFYGDFIVAITLNTLT